MVSLAVARGPNGFNKLVVLKTPKLEFIGNADIRQMFANEARLAARLNHANIVQTNEVTEEGGRPVIVMEYLDGQSLSSILAVARTRVSLAVHLRILADALRGLHYAHECKDFDGTDLNVVHRDMSPHNVFVTFDGQVKILDFGIAKLDDRTTADTATGIVKGKLRYMPPEQLAGEKIDRRADLYAMGMMLWEAAARRPMWSDETEREIMNRVLNGELPRPREVNPDVRPELDRICMKALAAEPSDRYATAAELEADVEAFFETLGTKVTHRELGRIMSDLFADVRAETKRTIEEQLGKVGALSWTDSQGLAAGGTKPNVIPSRKPMRLLFAGLGVAIAGAGAWARAKRPRPAAALRPTPAAASVVAAPPEPEPKADEEVSVHIVAVPSEAQLFLDDEPLPTNPFAKRMAKDDRPHSVRAEATGYTASSRSVTLDKDVDLVLPLERTKETPAKVRGALPRGAGAVNAPAKAPSANCSPPYYFDEQGLKKFKPECI